MRRIPRWPTPADMERTDEKSSSAAAKAERTPDMTSIADKIKDVARDAKNAIEDAAHDAKNAAKDAGHDIKNAAKDAEAEADRRRQREDREKRIEDKAKMG